MPISPAALKAMVAAGASAEAIVAAVEAEHAADKQRAIEQAEAKRAELLRTRRLAADRQMRKTARDKIASNPRSSNPRPAVPASNITQDHATSRVIQRDPPIPLPLSPTPPNSNPLTPFDDDDDRRARALKISEQVMEILGVDPVNTPIGWCGLADYLDRGIERGWRADMILIGARKVAASFAQRTDAHPNTLGYLTKPIDQAHEDQSRQLPIIGSIGKQSEYRHAGSSRSRPAQGGAFAAGLDRLARLAEQQRLQADRAEPGEGSDRDGGRDDPGRELPPRRSGVA